MNRSTLFTKLLCLLVLTSFSFLKNVNAQVLLHEGFEEDSTKWKTVNYGNSKWDVLTGGINSYQGDKCMYVTTDGSGTKTDCWLISTPVHFEAGKQYSISFYYKCQTAQDNRLEVSIGDTTTTSTTNLVWKKTFNNDTYVKGQINYIPNKTRKEHIKFHCTTKEMFTYLYFDEVTVQEVTCFEPLNISFSNVGDTSITAGWDTVAGALRYEYGVSNKDTIVPKYLHKTDSNSVNLTGLTPADTKFLYVRTRCSDTDSSLWAIAPFSTNYDCSAFETINCGDTIKKNYHGKTGVYPVVLCDQALRGPEFFHKFTPTVSGYYKLDNYSAGGNGIPLGFAYKESSLGCGNSDWNCIGISFGNSAMMFGPLEAGKEYIIMEKSDLQTDLPSDYSYKIECYTPPPVNDSCGNPITISVSDYTDTCTGVTLTTAGATPDKLNNDNSCGSSDGSNDDDVWVKFKAKDNAELFRFSNVHFTNKPHVLVVNFYSKSCAAKSLVDCGTLTVSPNKSKDIISYYFEKGNTYYLRISTSGIDDAATFNLCIMKPGVAKGPVDTCHQGPKITLQDKDKSKNVWIPLLSDSLRIIGAVNIDTNNIKNIIPAVYINKNQVRQDANGVYYMNRNFNIGVNKQPAQPVNVRLYFTNAEFNKLVNQSGSGVATLKDIRVTQTDASCSSSYSGTGTFIVPYARGTYDNNTKFVEFTTDHLSSFFLHGGDSALSDGSGLQNNASVAYLKNSIKVSPNPFTNVLYIEANEKTAVEYRITVTTFDGKPVRSFVKMLTAGNNKISLDMSSLSAGIYMLKIETPNGINYNKVIKQ